MLRPIVFDRTCPVMSGTLLEMTGRWRQRPVLLSDEAVSLESDRTLGLRPITTDQTQGQRPIMCDRTRSVKVSILL